MSLSLICWTIFSLLSLQHTPSCVCTFCAGLLPDCSHISSWIYHPGYKLLSILTTLYLSQWPIFNWLQMREQRFLISRNVLFVNVNSPPNYVSTCQLARSESCNPGRWHVFKYTSHTCVLSHINTHMHGLTNLHWCIKNKYSR